jgi:hypothetical protein
MPVTINGTTGIAGVDGSAGTPSVQGADTNTGIFFPAADTIAFAEGGAEVARFNSSGNFGIGTSSPQAKLHAVAATTLTDDATYPIIAGDSSSTNRRLLLGYLGSGNGYGVIQSVSSGTAWTDTAINPNGGSLLVGTTSTPGGSGNVRIEGTGGLYITNIPTTSTAGNCLISSGEGNRFYRSTSSLKYKRNVVDMQRGVQDVMQLRPVNFNGVSDFDGDKLFAGFIAEEVESLGFKEFVIYDDKGDPDGLQYANMVALLTKAIQEQQALITSLTARIAALEGAK